MHAVASNLSFPDTTFYPVDDGTGEGLLHRDIAELLRLLLARFLTQGGHVARVGANQFIYWRQHHPEVTLAPDVYILPGVEPEVTFDCWKVWETGVFPSFAIEIVSKQPHKDYVEAIERYEDLGVREVVIFDPKAGRPRSRRVRWQVFRRLKGRGLVRVEVTNDDRVRSRELGAWLRTVGHGHALRVRLSTGPRGEEIFPTEEEAQAARAEAAAVRTQAAEDQAQSEREARLAAEAELEKLRRELAARTTGKRGKRSAKSEG
jgi:hypothetical protein